MEAGWTQELLNWLNAHPGWGFATVLLVLGGIFSYFQLGQLEDPEFTVKTGAIITSYPGASAGQVELDRASCTSGPGNRFRIEQLESETQREKGVAEIDDGHAAEPKDASFFAENVVLPIFVVSW